MWCWLCVRRRAVVPLAVLGLGLVVAGLLVAFWRPLVPCGFAWTPGGQESTLYCKATGPVWP